MDQTRTTETSEATPIGRRTMLAGAAWSVPAISIVAATPAFAATGDTVTFTSLSVSPTATGAPTVYYVNISNNTTGTVTLGGAVTAGATVTVAWGSTSGVATTTGTSWTLTIPAASLPEGTITFSASVTGPPVVSVTGPQSVIKDTGAPGAVSTPTYTPSTNKHTGTISGSREAGATVTVTKVSGPTTFALGAVTYPNSTAWSVTWTGTSNGNVIGIKARQTDGAGNLGPETTYPTYTI